MTNLQKAFVENADPPYIKFKADLATVFQSAEGATPPAGATVAGAVGTEDHGIVEGT
jgi:hypothetical protein